MNRSFPKSIEKSKQTISRTLQGMKQRLQPTLPPSAYGALFQYRFFRKELIQKIIFQTQMDFSEKDLDLILSETSFLETKRLRQRKSSLLSALLTFPRNMKDRLFWHSIRRHLRKPPIRSDRHRLLYRVIEHYAEEIAGYFRPKVYDIATQVVPWFFNWLLNAASIQQFLPWKMKASIKNRLRVFGNQTHIQKLHQKGTLIFTPTHQSHIDSFLLGELLYLLDLPPFAFGAGLNLYANPILGFFMRSLGAYTVDRKKTNDIYKKTLKHFHTQLLERNISTIFYPGGTRSRSGALENKLKLGLLGTVIDAQTENYLHSSASAKPIFIVPVSFSYHFVFEAHALIEDYLEHTTAPYFFPVEPEEPLWPVKALGFFWKLFSTSMPVTICLGTPLNVLGEPVDENGVAFLPSGNKLDLVSFLTTEGTVQKYASRDRHYTQILGDQIIDQFYRLQVVLDSHLVAFSFFRALRRRYRHLPLYAFLRLSLPQRTLAFEVFLEEIRILYQQLKELEKKGRIQLDPDWKQKDLKTIVHEGIQHLGIFHRIAVLKVQKKMVFAANMHLLYYYRNRLSGYGLSLDALSFPSHTLQRGKTHAQGFLV